MQIGSKGKAVENLQQALKDLGYDVTVDGDYGPQTFRAVRSFQADEGLVADGIAGLKTLVRLAKVHKPKAPEPKPEPPPAPKMQRIRTNDQAVSLAWLWTTQKAKYILGEGGRNPNNSTPLTPDAKGVLGSDCVGFVLWCLGVDRYQPEFFTYYGGWMNTDSIIHDAKKGVGGGWWKLLNKPEVGSLVIFPSITKKRIGHVGLVVSVPAEWPDNFASLPAKEKTALLRLVKVIDCNASWKRKLSGKAIGQLTAADLWDKPDAVWVGWANK